MKAAICEKYGPPEVLQIKKIKKPICKSDEILVKIMATPVNSGDVKIRGLALNGILKFILQLVLGFSKPRKPILGMIYAGIIEEIGGFNEEIGGFNEEIAGKSTEFNLGDKVFGMTGLNFGTYAEYICIKKNSIISLMPQQASFEQAAALPFGWHTALHFLDKPGIEINSKTNVLVYGSTGAVGTAAIQWLQHLEANITVVCSRAGESIMNDLGVKNKIFYDEQNYTHTSQKFDIIFDAVGKINKKSCKHILAIKGKYITVGGWETAKEKLEHFHQIKSLFEQGKCKALIEKTYPFDDIIEAHKHVELGSKKGNVVLSHYCKI